MSPHVIYLYVLITVFNYMCRLRADTGIWYKPHILMCHGFCQLFDIPDCLLYRTLCPLTHWGRDKMAAIFQTKFSDEFSRMKMYKFWLRFHSSLFPRVQLTILLTGSDNGFGFVSYRRQAIIWTNAEPIHWRIYAALEGDESTTMIDFKMNTRIQSTDHRHSIMFSKS